MTGWASWRAEAIAVIRPGQSALPSLRRQDAIFRPFPARGQGGFAVFYPGGDVGENRLGAEVAQQHVIARVKEASRNIEE